MRGTQWAAGVRCVMGFTAAVWRRGAAQGAIVPGAALERWASEVGDVLETSRLGILIPGVRLELHDSTCVAAP